MKERARLLDFESWLTEPVLGCSATVRARQKASNYLILMGEEGLFQGLPGLRNAIKGPVLVRSFYKSGSSL